MKILYCNIGDMNSYNGIHNDSLLGGGSFNKDNIGGEVNNFTDHNGNVYGFVQATENTIDIQAHFECAADAESADGVLVVFLVKKSTVVGYYKDASVFRKPQSVPEEFVPQRVYGMYNLTAATQNAVLIPKEERRFRVSYPARMNVWYGDEKDGAMTNTAVTQYIAEYDAKRNAEIQAVEDFSKQIEGKEREAVVRQRVNQGEFRSRMLKRHGGKCCLCGVTDPELLVASHIKPWSKSDINEKVSAYNGLLLCPNHDKLFDLGYISFDETGSIMISDALDDTNRTFLNVKPEMKLKEDIVTEDVLGFLNYHRTEVFRKS